MFRKTNETKVMRDPVHGYIHVDYDIIWKCINTAWFQRLRRIRQLGGAHMVYHAADHTRFTHSLGVYEIVRRMVNEVPDLRDALDEKEKITVMLAGLLHDLGHGPYSHTFEKIIRGSHEEYTCRIIEKGTEITELLEAECPGLAKEVADVIRHTSKNPLLPQLVSGQLDADRMDYLLRDAYFTGTKYGEFDLERILRTLRVSDSKVVVKESGIYAVENYIMARYHMYWQVYYHPVCRSYESMLNSLFLRLQDLYRAGNMPAVPAGFRALAEARVLTLEEYFLLDEYTCGYGFAVLKDAEDPVVRDLASRVQDRRLFAYEENNADAVRRVQEALEGAGYDPRYYFAMDEVGQRPYVPYSNDGSAPIWIRVHGGEIKEISEASTIVSSLVNGPVLRDDRIFYPAEIKSLL